MAVRVHLSLSNFFPWLHSHLASSHPDQEVVKKDILLTLWQGIGMEVAHPMSLRGVAGAWRWLPPWCSSCIPWHGRTFLWGLFLKELTQEKRQLYAPVQRGLISTWAEVSCWLDLCCIKCALSKQVRMTRSGDRGAREESWGHANLLNS